MTTAKDVFGGYHGHWQSRRPNCLNTDEHPRVEFSAPVSHRDQTRLSGNTLRRHYDDLLARLPDRYERFPLPPNGTETRRAIHRALLFPN